LKVLLVDDDESICTAVTRLLQIERVDCEVAGDVDEALIRLLEAERRNIPYDMILLDLVLPGLAPEHLVQRVKWMAPPRPKVIIFSASMSAAEDARRMQADGFLEKPFDLSRLLGVLGKGQAGSFLASTDLRSRSL